MHMLSAQLGPGMTTAQSRRRRAPRSRRGLARYDIGRERDLVRPAVLAGAWEWLAWR
ncbi:MAG: hypothetical protein Fur0039_19290 [Rhodocyclaceae bacterium]